MSSSLNGQLSYKWGLTCNEADMKCTAIGNTKTEDTCDAFNDGPACHDTFSIPVAGSRTVYSATDLHNYAFMPPKH
ncbi:hypothetical protein N7504_004678 [Penicillium tannophilum]|nr:hypothetical protein N7504_004678 [Penicillium tannophilum]